MDERPVPGCLIITGLPGAGKTTVSRLVAARLPRAARIDGDDVNEMILTGRVGPVDEPADEAQRQLQLRARNVCALANNFDEAGFAPIIDHVLPDRATLDLMLGCLRTRPILLVILAPPLEVCRQRNAARHLDERVSFDFAFLDHSMRAELGDTGWWLDTTHLSSAATAAQVVQHASEHAVVSS